MAKSTRNSGKQWTKQEVAKLKTLARQKTPARVIGLKLGRTLPAIYNKASEKGIQLKRTHPSRSK